MATTPTETRSTLSVKFYRLGSDNTSVSKTVYDSYKSGSASTGIIFANVWNNNKLNKYIYANGIEYDITNSGGGSSNIRINVSTCEPGDYYTEAGLIPAHGDYYIKEECVSYINGSTNELTLPSDPSAIINQNVDLKRTAYIYNTSVWLALDGNINATNVYFRDGVKRTAAIGIHTATSGGAVTTEGIGKNLKELLEYYLVKELWPYTRTNGTFTHSSWTFSANGGKSRPDDLYTYIYLGTPSSTMTKMASNSAIVEVGSNISTCKIDIYTTLTHSGTTPITGTKASITGMYAYSTNGLSSGKVLSDSCTGTMPKATYTYYNNWATAEASIGLYTTDSSIITEDVSHHLMNNNVHTSLAALASTFLHEGTLSLTLNYKNNADASRSIATRSNGSNITVWPISNQDNVSSGSVIAYGANIPTSDTYKNATRGNNIKPKSSTVTITAVYPYYTNGIVQTVTETEGSWTTLDISIKESNIDKTVNAEKLALYNYKASISTENIFIGFGSCDENSPKIFYIPKSAGVTTVTGNSWNSNKDPGKTTSYDGGCGQWAKGNDVSIGNVAYTKFVNTGQFTPQNILIKFT